MWAFPFQQWLSKLTYTIHLALGDFAFHQLFSLFWGFTVYFLFFIWDGFSSIVLSYSQSSWFIICSLIFQHSIDLTHSRVQSIVGVWVLISSWIRVANLPPLWLVFFGKSSCGNSSGSPECTGLVWFLLFVFYFDRVAGCILVDGSVYGLRVLLF